MARFPQIRWGPAGQQPGLSLRYVEALGGHLRLVVHVGDNTFHIAQRPTEEARRKPTCSQSALPKGALLASAG